MMKRTILLLGVLIWTLPYCTKEKPIDPGWEYDPTPFNLEYPDFFPILEIPADNPTTVQGVLLGRMLYYDPILHKDSTEACASCHQQAFSFSKPGNIIPHINLGWSGAFLWNGKIQGTLEDIMLFESRDFFETDLSRLQNHPDYPKRFYEAFGDKEITYEHIAKAMAQFERTMISANSKYDQYLDPDQFVFLEDEEFLGYDIFFSEKGDCFHCHGGILFTDNRFHNNGLDANPEPGLSEITGDPFDVGRFKTPTLRNIELTGPYMHDSRYETLEEVIDFYSEGLKNSPTVDPLMKNVYKGGIQLTPQEKGYLLAFLKTLTDTTYLHNPALEDPFHE
ncbi:MAG: cytochrome-c peroxidase [Lewinellaceae bacterium]|nr:cytochrome-c peroxidase [Lewinellaceae bacterium]